MNRVDIFDVLSDRISIRMLSCNEAVHPGDWVESGKHADYDLWLVQAGAIEVTIGENRLTARPGDWVFFYPGMPYTARAADGDCRFVYVHFEFGIGDQVGLLEDFPLAGVVPEELLEAEGRMFSGVFHRKRAKDGLTRLELKGILTQIIARILQMHTQGRYAGWDARSGPKRSRIRHLDALQNVLAVIHGGLQEPVSISRLALTAGMSEKYFIAYFKRALGVTPGQYIYQWKMIKARDYLYSKKAYTMQEIAALLGYADAYTFSKAFKKTYNVPPSKFI